MRRLYVGAYTAVSGGSGAGLTVLEREHAEDAWRAVQVVEVDDPSFLALAGGALHAVSETTVGRVLSWPLVDGLLGEPALVAAAGGAAPCHVALDPSSGALVVAAYVGGTVGVLSATTADPERATRTLALPPGTGPVTARQEAPHAHQVVPTPRGTVLVADLGADRLHELRVDPLTLVPDVVAVHDLPAGSGPRHLDHLGDRLVVAGELDGHVHVLRRDGERYVLESSVPAFEGAGEHDVERVLLSHLAVHDGRVYVAVRGRDTISVLEPRVGAAGDQGDAASLALVAEVPCGGAWPRHFAIVDDVLVCANQGDDTVAFLPLDPATGVPGPAVERLALGSPACVVAA
ncbi:lactonase family protein [Frigoribacterium salinisoli]